ncbi:MAG TPA: RNA 2',3'-cyclic phosphodiesterase [Sphaerochaeta sp.]|nr:RNA 2',3'-cyclic phosphodiesterase [Sphaerochaeta sp.]
MRLFYALTFNPPTQTAIHACAADLLGGRRVQPEHIHLTLAFLGKRSHEELDALIDALTTLPSGPLELTILSLSSFAQRSTETVWAAIEPKQPVIDLHKRLSEALAEREIFYRSSSFIPHITLARRVPCAPLPKITPLSITVQSIALINSYQKRGVLTHTPIATRLLGRE